jgi:thioredoxin-related protein
MKIYFKFLAVLMFFAVGLSAGADETFPTLEANGITYTNVTVTVVTATDIYFTYNGGMGNTKIKNLSPELQTHFGFNPARADAQEKQQAQTNAEYESDKSSGQWGTDLPAALNQARSGNKMVLMDFTGSDWCPWCMKLDQEVFSTSQFAHYSRNYLELVRVDFPHNTPQSDDLRQANAALASRFGVDGYPTVILLDSSGRELGRQVGYMQGGLGDYLSWMESLRPKVAGEHGRNWSLLVANVGRNKPLLAGVAAGLVLFFLALKLLLAHFNSRRPSPE